MTKTEKQNEILSIWEKNNKIGYVLATGGFGKTYLAIQGLLKLKEEEIKHIVVPQIILRQQWEKEILKYKLKNAFVFVTNTYINTSMICDCLVIDEIHRIISEEATCFNKTLHESSYKYFLGLTATIDKNMQETLHNKNIKLLKEISFKEAIANEWVSPVLEFNIPIELLPWEQEEYNSIDKKCKYYFRTFNNNFEVVNKVLSDKNFRIEFAYSKGLEESILFAHATQFFSSIKKRKELTQLASNKYDECIKICTLHKDEKIIIFSESNIFSQKLDTILKENGLKSELYNSTITSKKRKQTILDAFQYSDTNILIGSKSLDQGLDIPSISVGIITSGTSSNKQQRQRLYRLSRFVENKQSILYNLIVKNTQEENNTIKRQKFSNVIEILNVI